MSYTDSQQKRAFLILMTALGILFITLLKPVLIPITLAGILATLLHPIYNKLLKIFRNKPYLTSFITTCLVFLLLVLPFGILLAVSVNQAVDFFSHYQWSDLTNLFESKEFYQAHIMPFTEQFSNRFHITLDLGHIAITSGKKLVQYLSLFSPQVLTGTLGFIFSFSVMHIALFFLFIEGKNILQVILDLTPIKEGYERKLIKEFENTIDATIYGYVVTAFIQAVLAAIGFAIAGVKAPLVFGLLTFIMSMVPLIGATSVWLPIAIVYFAQGHIGWGIFISVYGGLLISGIDNIIKPLIIQGKAKIHPVLAFFSLLGGIQFFGPIGILFGPVITSLFIACIRIYREDFLHIKN